MPLEMVSWLLSLIGRRFSAPKENTDSSAACVDIMYHMKELGFTQPSWAASKLKQGFGDAVCSVLDSLTDLALEAQGFQFKEPIYDQEMSLDEDVEALTFHDDGPQELCIWPGAKKTTSEEKTKTSPGILSNNVERQDASRDYYEESKIEAERMACQLRINMGSDGKDWRMHLSEARQLHSELSESLTSCCTTVQRVEEDISFFLDMLESREKLLNKQFEPLLSEYNAVRSRLTEVQQRHDESLENVTKCNHKLADTMEQLDKVKHKLLEKGNKISDVSPVLEMNNGIHSLKLELQEMEVRIGVLEHTLLQNQLSHSIAMTKLKANFDGVAQAQ